MKPFRLALLFLTVGLGTTVSFPGRAAEPEEIPEPFRTFIPQAQQHAAEFPALPVTTKFGESRFTTTHLDDKAITVGTDRFACVRFTTPHEDNLDLVWAFSTPANWRNWYILPLTGTMQGFQRWIDADRLYTGLPATEESPACLQTLPADRLKPDTAYILWFRETRPSTEPASLTAAIGFFAPPAQGAWKAETIDAALGLQTAPPEQQAEYLHSRGLHAVLDPKLFTGREGSDFVDRVLFTRRQFQVSSNGDYVAIEINTPPCKSRPLLADVRAAYGEPDLVLPPAEQKLLRPDGAADSPLYYYDYLAFATRPGEGGGERIVQVHAQGHSAHSLQPRQDGFTWGDSDIPELPLRVFYHDKKEVARVAHWGEGSARLLAGSLPKETFVSGQPGEWRGELRSLGEGQWEERTFYADGTPALTATLTDHAYAGVMRTFYPDGKPKVEAPYVHGEIDGTVKQWSNDGQTRELSYRAGRPVK